MPVDAYVGLPGSGKSYSVVEYVILPALKAGRIVVTNIPLKVNAIHAEYPGADVRQFDTQRFVDLARAYTSAGRDVAKREAADAAVTSGLNEVVPHGSVLVLDECWRLWPRSLGQRDAPPAFQSILAEHRHRVDEDGNILTVVLVTQDLMQIAPWARALVDQTFRTVKLSHVGMSKTYRVDIYQGAVTGPNPPKGQRIDRRSGKYRAAVFKYYESHTMRRGAGSGANEGKLDSRSSVWSSWVWFAGFPAVVVLLGFFVWYLYRWFHPRQDSAVVAASSPAVVRSGVLGPAVPGALSTSWQIIGSVENHSDPSKSVVWLSDGKWQVTISLQRNCRRWAEGWLECEYRGQQISNELQPVGREVVPSVTAVMPGFSSAAGSVGR